MDNRKERQNQIHNVQHILSQRVKSGRVFGIECASKVRMGWLRERLFTLQFCLPQDSYIIAVFPESVGAKAGKAVKLADEVWLTGKNGKIEQMMFSTTLHKE